VADQPFYAPDRHRNITRRARTPGEQVWRLQGPDARVVTCELRNDTSAGGGWDVQLFEHGELLFSQRCPRGEGARFTAESFRNDYLRTGFTE
jgi:hypothetical protein